MKTIVLFMMVILGTVIVTSAQQAKKGNNFQQKKFNTEVNPDTTAYFAISPTFKTDTSEIKIIPFHKLPGDLFTQNDQGKNDFFANRQKPELRMPVVGTSGRNYFNMPVAVPDSTVKYYIKEKRFESVNPLEKKYK